ncbi:MAG: group III truncated hemoglobin [Nitratireductor sp.]
MNEKPMTQIQTNSPIGRAAMHPSITQEQIFRLVEEFYGRVRASPRLGMVFEGNMSGPWDVHLEKMKGFWRSVLLRSGEYKGQPVPVHLKMTEIETVDFQVWIGLFAETANDVFSKEAAELVIEAARRIATSLWLSRAPDPFASPPAFA